MSIDAIFIISQSGELLAYKTYKGARRKELMPDFFNQYTSQFKPNADREYPIVRIKDLLMPFVSVNDVILGCIISEEIPMLQVFSILFLIMDVLKGANSAGLNSAGLQLRPANTAQMLDYVLDHGYPFITQKHVLEDLVKPPGVMEKIEEAIIGRQNLQKEASQLLDKYIEQQGEREHCQSKLLEIRGEESVFFDVIEYLDCVIDHSGKSILEEINGEIKMDCNLSGVPECYVFLNQTQFNDYSVHECILNKLESFERERVLQFVPPSGTTTIFYYNLKVQPRIPFDFIPKFTQNKSSARIEIKINNRPVRGQSYIVDEFHLKLLVPAGLTLGETELQQGQIQQMENALLWRIGKLDIDQSIRFVANYNGSASGNFLVCLKFVINTFSASSTKIDKVEVRNGAKVLTKKARNITKSGYYEIRLN